MEISQHVIRVRGLCRTSSLNFCRCGCRNLSSFVWQPQKLLQVPLPPFRCASVKLHPVCTLHFWLIVRVMPPPRNTFSFGCRRHYFSRGASTMFHLINLVWCVAWYMRATHTHTRIYLRHSCVRVWACVCLLACCDKFVGNCEFSHFSKLFCQLSLGNLRPDFWPLPWKMNWISLLCLPIDWKWKASSFPCHFHSFTSNEGSNRPKYNMKCVTKTFTWNC